MRAFVRESAAALIAAIGLVFLGVALGLLVAVRSAGPSGSDLAVDPIDPVATQTPIATARPTPRPTPRPLPSRSPTPLPSSTAVSSAEPDPAVVAAITASLGRLNDLRAYRFTVGVAGRNPLQLEEGSGVSFAVRGRLIQKPALALDGVVATQMVEFDGAAGISTSQRIVLVGDTVWGPRPGQSLKPEPASDVLQTLEIILPDGVVTRTIVPFAAGFERIGATRRNDVDAIHYRLIPQGVRMYADATRCDGIWSGDLWIAEEGGYLVAADVRCLVPDASWSGFLVQLDVTDANDKTITIEPLS